MAHMIRIAIALALLATTDASAGSNPPTVCEGAKTQTEINECMNADRRAVDGQLQETYDEYRTACSDSDRKLLEQAQQSWEKYRDAECAAAAARFEGGSMQPMELEGCRARLARERIVELKLTYDEPPRPEDLDKANRELDRLLGR